MDLNQKLGDSDEEARKIKCPFCKDTIPSNATRCSHCAADLTGEDARENIEGQIKQQKRAVAIGAGVIGAVFLIIVASVLSSEKSDTQKQIDDLRAKRPPRELSISATSTPANRANKQPALKFTILLQLDARTDILVDPQPPADALKDLIVRLSQLHCVNKTICIINFYDSRVAYNQLSDFSSPIFDKNYSEIEFQKIETHFVGQYSSLSGLKRYRKGEQWVNF